MRHALASLVLALFLFPSIAMGETVRYVDLVVREGLYYKKFTTVPFTGKITGNAQGSFKDGKKHGPWVFHWANGQLMTKGTLIDGKEVGPWVFYNKDGTVWHQTTYKDGKQHGPWVEYHKNGQLREKGTYKDGKRDGPWVGYKKDGTVDEYFTGTFRNGVKVK